jgi:hypothetical protein
MIRVQGVSIKKITKRLVNVSAVILCMVFAQTAFAAQKSFVISGTTITNITGLVSGDTATITGHAEPTTAQTLNIPAGAVVIWKAELYTPSGYPINLLTVGGDGTFIMAGGYLYIYTGSSSSSYYALTASGNVKVIFSGGNLILLYYSGGYRQNTFNCTATNPIVIDGGNYSGSFSVDGKDFDYTNFNIPNFKTLDINGGTISGSITPTSATAVVSINGGTVNSSITANNIVVKGGVTGGSISASENLVITGGVINGEINAYKDINVSGKTQIYNKIKAYGNVNISGGVYVEVSGGNAIEILGPKSKVILSDSATVKSSSGKGIFGNGSEAAVEIKGKSSIDAGSGNAISLTGVKGTVKVAGGTVKTTTGTAIYMHGEQCTTTVSAGRVEATTGTAIYSTGAQSKVTVSGGTVFSYSSSLTGQANSVIVNMNFSEPTGSGAVLAWDEAASLRSYLRGESADILSLPAATNKKWDKGMSADGIDYANGANVGFIEIPEVLVSKRAATSGNLNYAIPTDRVYNGLAQGIGTITAAAGAGAITVKYNGITAVPVNAGNYLVSVDVAEGDYYGASSGIALGTYVIGKANGLDVPAPSADTKTKTSIKINAVAPPVSGQIVEYAKSTINTAPAEGWQTDLTFAGLVENTDYYIFARSQENTNYKAGTAVAAAIRTLDANGNDNSTPINKMQNGDTRFGIKFTSGNIVSDKAEFAVILPDNDRVLEVKAVIYDNTGNVVFEKTERVAKVSWDLTNAAGRSVANGTYLIIAEAKGAKGTYAYSAKVGVKR